MLVGGHMKRYVNPIAVCLWLVLVGIASAFHKPTYAQDPVPLADTEELRAQYEQWRQDFKTWGRWGTGDSKGASNLITPEKGTGPLENGNHSLTSGIHHPCLPQHRQLTGRIS